MAWPPTLADLRSDREYDESITRDDAELQRCLDAAVAFVEHVRSDLNFGGDAEKPSPDAAVTLGTIRLAARWFTRRRSPDALVEMGELGSGRVPSFDPDIERLLRIGRYRPWVIA